MVSMKQVIGFNTCLVVSVITGIVKNTLIKLFPLLKPEVASKSRSSGWCPVVQWDGGLELFWLDAESMKKSGQPTDGSLICNEM